MWMLLPEIVMQSSHYGRAHRSHRWGAGAKRQVPRLIFQISRRQFGEAEPANPKGLSPCETKGSNPVASTREPNRKVRLISK